MSDDRLDRWLAALAETPGLTSVEPTAARRVLLEEALVALPALGEGPVVDVGSGGGSPGIPLAAARPDLSFVLLDSNRRKCDFLERASAPFGNVTVVCARAEEYAAREGRERFGTAVARALAPPPAAAEWCLPLVREGGLAVLLVGESADAGAVAEVALQLAAEPVDSSPGLLVLRKTGPTPERFPRRPGIARKRPLA